MIDKNLLGFITTVLALGIALIGNESVAETVMTKSSKSTNLKQSLSQKINQEPNQISPYLNNIVTQNTAKQTTTFTDRTYLAQGIRSGKASWYGPGFHGRYTANGEIFNQNALTAAHRSLPFGTKVRVTNVNNGRSVVVRINDRGPFAKGRVIDLSAAAAHNLGMIHHGVVPVRLEVLRY